jgi:hypothetical protein
VFFLFKGAVLPNGIKNDSSSIEKAVYGAEAKKTALLLKWSRAKQSVCLYKAVDQSKVQPNIVTNIKIDHTK